MVVQRVQTLIQKFSCIFKILLDSLLEGYYEKCSTQEVYIISSGRRKPMSIPEKFISCTFSEGMLSSEYSVTIHHSSGDFALFVPKGSVKVIDKAKGKGLLRVRIVDQEHNVVALPGEIIDIGRRFLEFSPDELESL